MNLKKIFLFIILFLFFVISLSVVFLSIGNNSHDLKVNFFDVGQGDASLIQTPLGQNILVDGGPNNKVLLGLSKSLPFWDRTIDLVVLTHPHDDHVSGLISVLERYKVNQILYVNLGNGDNSYKYWLELAKKNQVEMANAADLSYIDLGENCGFHIFYPQADLSNQIFSNLNNTSIVMQLDCLDKKILFTGDAEAEEEEYLLDSNSNLDSDIIKIAHHGSNTSSSVEFLEAVSPDIAIISVGVNNYFGHPSLSVINRLERENIRVYRTDLDGTIFFEWKAR